jgi:bifunctional non-homologous end joining protein LigD
MSLEEYRRKRSFSKTPEPEGRAAARSGQLRFVVQEHHATRLHWDFRLEMTGTLKSWAVPKGPTFDPNEKRLAVPVEDHPLDYMDFEGVIPKGNYGAGTVMVWDRGTYESLEGDPQKGYDSGKLAVRLAGKKLRGEFHLVRTKMGGQTQWLMFKRRDADAVAGWVLPEPSRSVKSGRTIDEISREETARWHATQPAGNGERGSEEKANRKGKRAARGAKTTPPGAQRALKALKLAPPGSDAFPKEIKPTLATLIEEPFNRANWVFEIKWDGIRAVSYLRRAGAERQVVIRSRGGHVINEQFPEVVEALYSLDLPDAVLDGEIVALDDQGRSSFPILQARANARGAAKPPLAYYVFDLLYLNGHLLVDHPLRERRQALEAVLPEHPLIRLSETVAGAGTTFYGAAQNLGVEGVMAKRADSPYQPGKRTSDWLKLKVKQRLDAVVAGFTEGLGGRAKTFGALLLGAYEDQDRLRYIGHCGGGFTDRELRRIHALLLHRVQPTCPFPLLPPTNEPATWVRPDLVVDVEYGGWTADGLLRFPVYKGLRDDKMAREVKLERALPVASVVGTGNGDTRTENGDRRAQPGETRARPRETEGPGRTAAPVTIPKPAKARKKHPLETALEEHGLRVELTNLDKVFWPGLEYTKADLLEYYLRIAPFILPHLRDRPVTLRRFPNGVTGESFYQKDVQDTPPFVQLVEIFSGSSNGTMRAPVCNNVETLLWLAQLADIEMHAWFSRTTPIKRSERAGTAGVSFAASGEALGESVLNRPDFVVFDIDPYLFPDNRLPQRKGEKDPDYSRRGFEAARAAALRVREVLAHLKLKSFLKTSGKTGLHVFVPLVRRYTFEQTHEFAKTVTQYLEGRHPKELTTAWAAEKRVGKVFLDYNQNRLGATLASAYSVRPTPEATVSIPLTWRDLDGDLDPLSFTLRATPDYMKRRKDPWADILASPQRLETHL